MGRQGIEFEEFSAGDDQVLARNIEGDGTRARCDQDVTGLEVLFFDGE